MQFRSNFVSGILVRPPPPERPSKERVTGTHRCHPSDRRCRYLGIDYYRGNWDTSADFLGGRLSSTCRTGTSLLSRRCATSVAYTGVRTSRIQTGRRTCRNTPRSRGRTLRTTSGTSLAGRWWRPGPPRRPLGCRSGTLSTTSTRTETWSYPDDNIVHSPDVFHPSVPIHRITHGDVLLLQVHKLERIFKQS